MSTEAIIANTKQMIDDLKTVCANFGLGNASSEYKIITEIFLYKFLNDKFIYEVQQADEELKNSENVEQALNNMSEDDYEMLMMLGTKIKVDGKNQRTVLSPEEIENIINTFNNFEPKDDFSVVVDYDKIEQKKCSFSAGQYFEVKIEYVELTQEEFQKKMDGYTEKLTELFAEGNALQTEILEQLKKVKYEDQKS